MTLALKYRPKNFDEIIGQEAIVRTLKAALDKNKISNAYLFSGLRGSGKTSTARIFSKALQCDKGPTSHPCEECENCKMANSNSHIDIIEMDAASNRKIDDIREIIEQTKYKPSIGRYKIFIIDEVHMLTKEAFNALLKTLEEPPEYVKFILATTDPLKLPATILSRVQHFRFTKIPIELIIEHLKYILAKENVEYEDKAIEMIAKVGEGSLRDTITLLEQAIIYSKNYIDVENVSEMLGIVNPSIIKDIFESISKKDINSIKQIVSEIKNYDLDFIFDEIMIYLKDELFHNNFSFVTIDRFFKIVADMRHFSTYYVDNEFLLDLMFFKMVEAMKSESIDDMIKNLELDISSSTTDTSSIKTDTQPIKIEKKENKFQKLITELKDRDLELGECFEKSIEFVSFDGATLVWNSCPDEKCKELLRRYYSSIIKIKVQEIFGLDVVIKANKCKQPEPQVIEQPKNIVKEDEKFLNNVIKTSQEVFGDEIEIKKLIRS